MKTEKLETESVRDKKSPLYNGLQCLGGRHHSLSNFSRTRLLLKQESWEIKSGGYRLDFWRLLFFNIQFPEFVHL